MSKPVYVTIDMQSEKTQYQREAQVAESCGMMLFVDHEQRRTRDENVDRSSGDSRA